MYKVSVNSKLYHPPQDTFQNLANLGHPGKFFVQCLAPGSSSGFHGTPYFNRFFAVSPLSRSQSFDSIQFQFQFITTLFVKSVKKWVDPQGLYRISTNSRLKFVHGYHISINWKDVKILEYWIKFALVISWSLGQMSCPSQIPAPRQKFWSNAPGSPEGMVTLGIDWYIKLHVSGLYSSRFFLGGGEEGGKRADIDCPNLPL